MFEETNRRRVDNHRLSQRGLAKSKDFDIVKAILQSGDTMYNLVDLVQIKTKRKREEVEEILNAAINVTKETLEKGNDVYWVGLCRFTYKQKAKTKAQAKEWTEFPYLAEGDKVRLISDIDGIEGKGSVLNIEKTTKGNTNV